MNQTIAFATLGWFIIILIVSFVGCLQIYRHFCKPALKPISPYLRHPAVPHVTVIRPVSGIEPFLYDCLASAFHQSYPIDRLTIYFCVSKRADPAFPILQRLIENYPGFDAHVFVEDEDPALPPADGTDHANLGPNPKIRNMSRAYREAKGDIVWIVDSNVWVSSTTAGHMVDLLCGLAPSSARRRYKFVHQLPLAVDISAMHERRPVSSWNIFRPSPGSILDELFLSTSHAKYYAAIASVAIAPCTVGKSNMFRRSHLDALTKPSANHPGRSPGIDYFSDNICEDHLIGDLLWKTRVPQQVKAIAAKEGREAPYSDHRTASSSPGILDRFFDRGWGNHALLFNPPCIQPLARTSLFTYAARRARWLRVRKFTVPAATLVEPGVESLLAVTYGAFGLTTLDWCHEALGVPKTWTAFSLLWCSGMLAWVMVDRWLWGMLQGWRGEEGRLLATGSIMDSGTARDGKLKDVETPSFVGYGRKKTLSLWFLGWAGRELLAFPIWAWAVLGGSTVIWKNRRFKVGMDMRVYEIPLDMKKTQ